MKIEISGLPPNMNELLPGRIYAFISLEAQLVRQVISDTLVAQKNLVLVSQEPAAQYLTDKGVRAWGEKQFDVLSLSLDKVQSEKNRAQRVCKELDYFNAAQKEMLIIDPAEALLGINNTPTFLENLTYLQNWAFQSQSAILLVFSKLLHRPAYLKNLIEFSDRFAGIVRLDSEKNTLSWNVLHWFSLHGMQGQAHLELTAKKVGDSLQIKQKQESNDSSMSAVSSLDDEMVYITQTAIADARDIPEMWVSFQSIDELVSSVKGVVNASIVLDYIEISHFEMLLRQVYKLRHEHGNHIKIIVREMNATIRHYHEQLLLRLGCTMIVPSSVSFSRFVSMLKTLDGQVFSQSLGDDFESEINNIPSAHDVGYLKPSLFVSSVSNTLKGMKLTGVQGTLLIFNMAPGIGALETVRLCRLKRDGDVCTVSETNLYVFLFACRESDVSLSLDAIFELPVNELFVDQTRSTDVYSISDSLKEITNELKLKSNHFIDYTSVLALGVMKTGSDNSEVEPERSYKPKKSERATTSPLRMKSRVSNA